MGYFDELLRSISELGGPEPATQAKTATKPPATQAVPPPTPVVPPVGGSVESASGAATTVQPPNAAVPVLTVPGETRPIHEQPVRTLPRAVDGAPGFAFRVDPQSGEAVRYLSPEQRANHPQVVPVTPDLAALADPSNRTPAPPDTITPGTAPQTYTIPPEVLALGDVEDGMPTGLAPAIPGLPGGTATDPLLADILTRSRVDGAGTTSEETEALLQLMMALAAQEDPNAR